MGSGFFPGRKHGFWLGILEKYIPDKNSVALPLSWLDADAVEGSVVCVEGSVVLENKLLVDQEDAHEIRVFFFLVYLEKVRNTAK